MRFLIIGFSVMMLSLVQLQAQPQDSVTVNHLRQAQAVMGLSFDEAELDSMLELVNEYRMAFLHIRQLSLSNEIPPALNFHPLPKGFRYRSAFQKIRYSDPVKTAVPERLEDLAYWSVRDLGELIRTGKITSEQLTRLYLERLKKYGPRLECVITLMEEEALREAREADREIAAGKYRGPLHGIPYGIKDLFAVKGTRTTWGAMPYKDQVIDMDATVVKKLREAGAVLVAKLTLGALAWGDVWYGGKTRNPWDLSQGSSGSSAGSAAATAAGLVAFAIGTETWGSIVSPSTRCGVTGLRPTFGRVSRYGAMALSWSMDKVGPICRTAEDCAIVLEAIQGPDGEDPSVWTFPFAYEPEPDLKNLKIGYIKEAFEEDYPNKAFDEEVLNVLKTAGAQLIPISLPSLPTEYLSFILNAEAAAAFDELTRSNRDSLMVRQIKNAWPNVFRASRFIPAVEYIQANRIRYQLIQEMEKIFAQVDLYICPTYGANNLLLTNLTGHPSVVIPTGFNEKGQPVSITIIGRLFDEGTILSVANLYQRWTDHHLKHPPLFP